MSISAIASLIFGFIALIGAFVFEGGNPLDLLAPTAALIVFGGTIAAVGLSFPSEVLTKIPKILGVAFKKPKNNMNELIDFFKDISIKTRKNGLLSIEGEISANPDIEDFIKKGLQMVVDGVEPQTVRNVMETQAYLTSQRHKEGIEVFNAAGGFSPTMGIIGTVMGLVHVLGSLDDASSLGPKIAVAFIATLYGVSFANLVYLPIANQLKALNKTEEKRNELITEAVLSIQEGLNPNTLAEKLKSYLDKKELEQANKSTVQVGE